MSNQIFKYGSRVYGTHHENSDHDFIVVGEYTGDIVGDLQFWTNEMFEEKLKAHDITALECISQVENASIDIDLDKLRRSISAVASNAWAKAHKKLMVDSPDYAPYIGKKSAWHALRVIDFGCQIAEHGRIINFSSMNHLYQPIMDCAGWDEIKQKYQSVGNELRSRFRLLAPKID